MKVFKQICNVMGILLALILSLPLVVSLVVAPVVSGASEFVKIENLKKIVNEIDFESIVGASFGALDAENAQIMEILSEEGIIDELASMYVENLFSVLDGNEQAKITVDDVMGLFEKHMDSFVETAKQSIDPEQLPYISDETIVEQVRGLITPIAQAVPELLPSLDELGIPTEVFDIIELFRAGKVILGSVILVAVLAFLVFLCRVPRFKGFMWLGVDFVFGGGFTFALAMLLGVGVKKVMTEIPFGDVIISPAVNIFSEALKKGAIIELGLAVLFIVIFIVGRVILKKKAVPQTV